jgi:hypothetical protein
MDGDTSPGSPLEGLFGKLPVSRANFNYLTKIKILDHAYLPKLRAPGTDSELDIAAVFAVRKQKPALPVLF